MESEKKYCTLYIVRHGETEYNAKQIIQGQVDSPLTALGLKQAKDTAKMFEHISFDAVFSSDLLRAQRTAEIIALERQLVINTSELIRERRFGKYEGKPVKQWREESEKLLKSLGSLSEPEKRALKFTEDYESEEDLVARFLIFLREIAVTYSGKNVLVVSHGGTIRSLLLHLGFAQYDELRGKTIDNLAYLKILSDGTDFFIKETKGINKRKV